MGWGWNCCLSVIPSQGARSGTPLRGISFHHQGAVRHQMAPLCRSCTQRNWQQELTSPGPQLETLDRGKSHSLYMASAKPICYYNEELPKRDLVLSSTPSQAQMMRNFPCRAAQLHNPSWDEDSPRSGPTDRPGQRWVWSKGDWHKVCLFLGKTKAILGWLLKWFWSLLADGLAKTFLGRVM